ncbi:MAG: hypothetical protein FWF69_06215 [Firmicutes bacterium]|nr:hypothetical protein [Bacillota bacterium]
MSFAVVGYFDENSDKAIKSLWKGMADLNVCNYLINSANNPHIKFAIFNELDVASAEKSIHLLTDKIQKISVHFKSYSFYPNDMPFICIDIAVSLPILKLQSEIQNSFDKNAIKDERDFFEQGIWKPDCQLTRAFDRSKLASAINYLSETQLPFDGVLERIGLIEFFPAKQLFSYNLL